MSKGRDRVLSVEERILWSRVARSATPLAGRAAEHDIEPPDAREAASSKEPVRQPANTTIPARTPRQPEQPRRIDAPEREKLVRGRLPIEGKLDLHGLTQGEAHALLLSFLQRAHSDGRRHVLVVTGKGTSLGSEGALRRALPAWLSTPLFRGLVHSHSDAGRRHGGSGAVYVRLRRRSEYSE